VYNISYFIKIAKRYSIAKIYKKQCALKGTHRSGKNQIGELYFYYIR